MRPWQERVRLIARAASALGALLAPACCAACDAPLAADVAFCEECGPCPAPPPSDALGALGAAGAIAAGAYAPPLSTAIQRFKFGQRTDLAAQLSALLPALELPASALIIPVPAHRTRLVERGFNPPALLARPWSRRLGAMFAPSLLSRWRDTPHQVALSAAARALNVRGAFVASAGAAGRQAVLLDDVVTTGATLEACRRALYAAGVVHVTVIALAATPRPA